MTAFSKKTISLLNSGRISEAIYCLRTRLIADRNTRLLDDLNQIELNYSFLLKYLADGHEDTGRQHTWSNLREQLYGIVRKIEYDEEMRESPTLYFTLARTLKYSGITFDSALKAYIAGDSALQLLDPESEETRQALDDNARALKDIFSVVWTITLNDSDTLRKVVDAVCDNSLNTDLRSVMISALTINLLTAYDRQKLSALIEIFLRCEAAPHQVRALTGILLAMHSYAKRVANDYDLRIRFDTMAETSDFSNKLNEIFFSLIKARGGINLSNKIRRELLPEITKMGPDFINKLKDKDGNIDIEKIEQNPEWEKMMQNKMGKKLKKLSDIQESGGDVMLSMFTQLYSKFHQFNDIDVWFRPFSDREAMLLGIPDKLSNVWKQLSGVSQMCDLDKLVFAINISRMPEAFREQMVSAFESAQEQLREQMGEEMKSFALRTSIPDFKIEAWNYARDLFRFFNFFRLRSEFFNPFAARIDICRVPMIGRFFNEPEVAEELSDYYFRQEFYTDAIECLKLQARNDILNQTIYLQKIGYCYEKLGQERKALDKYLESLDLGDDSEWTLKKIYKLGEKIGDFEHAFSALRKLIDAYPDNLDYLRAYLRIGAENYPFLKTDLSKEISRAKYMMPEEEDIERYCAVYSLYKGNYAEAAKFFSLKAEDARMYLAGSSLLKADEANGSAEDETDNTGKTTETDPEEKRMVEDLIFDAAVNINEDDPQTAISSLSLAMMLKKSGISRNQLQTRLQTILEYSGADIPETILNLYLDTAGVRH